MEHESFYLCRPVSYTHLKGKKIGKEVELNAEQGDVIEFSNDTTDFEVVSF